MLILVIKYPMCGVSSCIVHHCARFTRKLAKSLTPYESRQLPVANPYFQCFESLWDLSGFWNCGSLSHAEHENPAKSELHICRWKWTTSGEISAPKDSDRFRFPSSSSSTNSTRTWAACQWGCQLGGIWEECGMNDEKNWLKSPFHNLWCVHLPIENGLKMARPRLPRHCRLRCQMARRSWAE